MIHSARPIVTPVANIAFCCLVFLDLKSGDGRTDNMRENNDPYRPWLWVGQVDQLTYVTGQDYMMYHKSRILILNKLLKSFK